MSRTDNERLSRRSVLQGAAAALGGAALAGSVAAARADENEKAQGGAAVTKGRIRQSVVQWCFADHWDVEETAKVARKLGCQSVELVAPEHWPMLKEHGLTCAIASVDMSPDPPFAKGWNNPEHWPRVEKATRDAIAAAAEHGVPSVIAFTGYAGNVSRKDGLANCVKGLKRVIGEAEKAGVTLCLEMLNTRDDTHPMKGHPGYQGDDIDYCAELCKRVESERMKLLFDIYHVQIMNGDLVRRVHQYKNLLGHIHTAGNPGRGELDEDQEINYPAVMRALLDVGYKGYVGQEFIPTRDPLAGLTQAVRLCDV